MEPPDTGGATELTDLAGVGAPGPIELESDGEAEGTRRGLKASFLASILIQGINMATGIILARSLGVEDRGALAAALLWGQILGAIATLGIPEAVTFRTARDRRVSPAVVGTGLALVAALSVTAILVAAVVLPFALARQSSSTLLSAYLFLGQVPLTNLILVMMGVLNGRGRYSVFAFLRVLVVAFVLALLATLTITGGLTVRSAVFAYLAAYLAAFLATAWALWRRERPGLRLDRATGRGLLSYGVKSHAGGIATQLNLSFPQLVVSVFLTPRQLGIYVVAVAFNSIGWLIGGSVAYVALPAVAALEEGVERTLAARRFISLTLGASILVAVPLVVLAPQLVDLFFGHSYHAAADVCRVLLLSVVIFATNRSTEAVLRALGRPLDAGLGEIIAIVATLLCLAVLLPLLGLIGAAASALVAALISFAWMTRRAARALGVRAYELVLPTRADLKALASAKWLHRRRSSTGR